MFVVHIHYTYIILCRIDWSRAEITTTTTTTTTIKSTLHGENDISVYTIRNKCNKNHASSFYFYASCCDVAM